MKNVTKWLVIHLLHWVVLYGAFVAQEQGAMNLLTFWCFSLALLSPFFLTDSAIANAVKNPKPQPVFRVMGFIQSWMTLGLLIWFWNIAAALAWAFVMMMAAVHRQMVAKARSESVAA